MDFLTICITFFNLGFFGGFLHCTSMCSPFVIHQVSAKLSTENAERFFGTRKFLSLSLFPYHIGRITTYSIIGFCCSLFSSQIVSDQNFNFISGLLLIFASLFILLAILPKKWLIARICNIITIKLVDLVKFLPFSGNFNDLFQKLFINTNIFKGFTLGVILGFLPCGLLYSAFAVAFTINEPLFALFGMIIFGIATVPALFLVGLTGFSFFKFSKFNIKFIARLVILINCVTILLLGINLLTK